jgi:glycosyltransferase involved in cell wall biosynthesis
MYGLNRLVSRRALTLASDPAAWQALAAEQAWRLRRPCPPACNARQATHATTTIYWPTEYQHFDATSFVRPLREGLGKLATLEPQPIPQPYEGIVILGVSYGDVTFSVAVDYYDYPVINEDCLKHVSIYFKMQHRRAGYGDPKIFPGGYVAARRSLYDHYCRLRELRRSDPKFDVYGRFGLRSSAEIRSRAVAILQSESRFEFTGGTSLALYMQSLREAARARVCIDMPGNGPFCHRLVDYLAMGCCIVAPRHDAIMHAELRDREHIVYCRSDLADLADICAHYIDDKQARRRIELNASRFFDEHLYPTRLASYYLQTLTERLIS